MKPDYSLIISPDPGWKLQFPDSSAIPSLRGIQLKCPNLHVIGIDS